MHLIHRRRYLAGTTVALAVALLASACSSAATSATGSASSSAASANVSGLASVVRQELAGQTPAAVAAELAASPPLGIGQAVPGYPNGVTPSPADIFHFSAAQIARLRAGHYTAAIAMHLMNAAWPRLQVQGITDTLSKFGIKVVAVTNANFNAATQINDVGTLIARHPNVIFSLPVNPVTEAATYKGISAAGIKLVLLDNVPAGLVPGRDYVTVVSADNAGNATFASQQLTKALACRGQVGYLGLGYYFYVVTVRDQAAARVLSSCPQMSVVRQSFTDPTTQAYNEASDMLLAHPQMAGMWAAWNTVAEQVVAAEKAGGHKPVYIATTDLGPVSALEMAQGYIQAIGAQQPYYQGVAEANAAAYSLLGEKVPYYIELPTVPVTLTDLLPAYVKVMHAAPPANVVEALKKTAGL